MSISEDEHTTSSTDTPPKSFEPLLNSSIHHLRLRINCESPDRDIELTLSPGDNSGTNCIILQSPDEDWVNASHTNVSKLLDSVKPQSVFIRKNALWLVALLAILIGWPIRTLFLWAMVRMGEAHSVPWSWKLFGSHFLIAGIFGVLPAFGILLFSKRFAFPGIEMQTGPSHTWEEARWRSRLNVVCGLLVVGPLGNLIYDIYRAIVSN